MKTAAVEAATVKSATVETAAAEAAAVETATAMEAATATAVRRFRRHRLRQCEASHHCGRSEAHTADRADAFHTHLLPTNAAKSGVTGKAGQARWLAIDRGMKSNLSGAVAVVLRIPAA